MTLGDLEARISVHKLKHGINFIILLLNRATASSETP
jgi:hypothetical protein